MRQRSARTSWAAVAALLLLSLSPCMAVAGAESVRLPAIGTSVETERYRVTLTAAREVREQFKQRLVWQYTFRVEDRVSHAVRALEYPAPDSSLGNELRWFSVVGDRLFTTRRLHVGAFSLAGGKTEADMDALNPLPSPDGSRIAYLVLQPRGLAAVDSGTIVVVLDLATMTQRYVFPEPDRVNEFHNGPGVITLVTELDPAKQHEVLNLFWSPDSARLLFFCRHGLILRMHMGPMYVAVVDLHKFPAETRFVHLAIDPAAYRKKRAPVKAEMFDFIADAVTWLGGDKISVRPRRDFGEVKNPFELKLPEVPPATATLAAEADASRPKEGDTVDSGRYRVTLATAQQIQERDSQFPVWQYIFRIEDPVSQAVQFHECGGVYDGLNNELRWFGARGDRLVTARRSGIEVFNLATGRIEDDLPALDLAPSPSGDVIAYSVLMWRFDCWEWQGSIVAVLDLATGKHRYVFPRPGSIKEAHEIDSPFVFGPERNAVKRHNARNFFWSPAGDRLAFVCAHGFVEDPAGSMYLVVVDLGGPSGSRFFHRRIPPRLYSKTRGSEVYFAAESITWIDARTIEIQPAADYTYEVRDRFVVKIPEVSK